MKAPGDPGADADEWDAAGVRPRLDLHLGIRTRSDSPGTCVATMRLRPEHRNIEGRIHGGVFLTLLDTTMGHAVASKREEDVQRAATMQLSCQFLAPPVGERMECHARIVRLGGRSAFVEGSVRDEHGTEIARAHGVWRVWRAGDTPP
ncbi:MAG: PaaI family thioesterase [Gemmatimonadetes bacterium]|nr:PaaI family thioesterase [Gemmatimonadota bacterium]